MTTQVFYRKWRPQSLAEVVGQEHVTKTLRHAVAHGRVAHAYLFCGPRGTGKTSTGRILAKAVNCLDPVEGEPCNSCQMCQAINEGAALDVIEIDAASNRGIEDIREIRERVNYATNLSRYKVYIIDEVHMLTEAASNALLKTLEEPPAHVIFILATTEPHKVSTTIVSRCQRFDFHRLSQPAVVSKLGLICDKEGIHAEPEVLRLIARVTTGSLRDAENLLQQMVAYYGHEINLYQMQTMLGISGDLRVAQLASCIVSKDISSGLQIINDINNDGLDLRQFNRELVDHLRQLLLIKSDCERLVDVTGEDLVEMQKLASDVALDYLLMAVKLFGGLDFRLDNYSSLPLELALVECILSTSERKQPVNVELPVPGQLDEVVTPSPEPIEISPQPETPLVADVAETVCFDSTSDIGCVRSRWKDFIQAMRGYGAGGNLDAVLRSACEPLAIEDNTLVLGFYHDFHKERIEDSKNKYQVEQKLREVFGQPYQIRCVITKLESKAPPRTEMELPLVKAALSMGAEIIDEDL